MKEALDDKSGNDDKCCNNPTIYTVAFLKTQKNAGGCPVPWEKCDKTEMPSYAPTRTLFCVPVLGVTYALLCGVMLPNGTDSGSKEAWGKHKYHTCL